MHHDYDSMFSSHQGKAAKRQAYADLNQPVKLRKRHDLAASIEVAEHLLPERSESFVADLCKLSDTVLFSAGIPHQGGAGHINLRYQHEWAEIFAEQGYACFDPIRRRMAAMGDIYPTLYHRRERNLARRLRKARMEAKLAKAGEG
mgnify:CR=1 FL=1